MFNLFMAFVIVVLIYTAISWLWQVAELKFYGKVTPRVIDDVVAIVLAISLYMNLK